MFTGIIQEIGCISKIEEASAHTITIQTSETFLSEKEIGQSIAVNGACMTIIALTKNTFSFNVLTESLKRTNLQYLKNGDQVNLESALKLNQGIDGHLVQGHIDNTGTIKKITQENNDTVLKIAYPKELQNFLAFKGSITVNGVSLTISKLERATFEVTLVKHTLEHTNLSELKEDSIVNLEVDLIARYLERMLNNKEKESKFHFLKEHGFI